MLGVQAGQSLQRQLSRMMLGVQIGQPPQNQLSKMMLSLVPAGKAPPWELGAVGSCRQC